MMLLAGVAALVAGCSGSGSVGAARSAPTASSLPAAPGPDPAGTPGPTTVLAAPVVSPPPAASGPPYRLTSTVIPLVDTHRPTVTQGTVVAPTRALTTLVWAPSAPGRRPLVVFAHGFQVGPGPYTAMLKAWAAHGYVVAAPRFPLTDETVAGANLDESDLSNEPADLRFVIDALIGPTSPTALRIDPARVAVAGHSDGAEAALAASVAPVSLGQPRIRAVMAMSVSPVSDGATLANPPALVTQGDDDSINAFEEGQRTYGQVVGPKYFLDLLGGEHLAPLEAGSAWLPTVTRVTEDFVDLYVAGGGSASRLIADANHAPLTSLRVG